MWGQAELVPACRELGVGIVAYSPLGRGFFTGKLTSRDQLADSDFRTFCPRFIGDAFEKVGGAPCAFYASKGRPPSTQVCLAVAHADNQNIFIVAVHGYINQVQR